MKYTLNLPYYVSKIKNHKKIKKDLLNIIEKDPHGEFADGVSKVDFYYRRENKHIDPLSVEYMSVLFPNIQKALNNFLEDFIADGELEHSGIRSLNIQSFWYQQYTNMQSMHWHIHDGADISLVYYLEMPDGTHPTAFKDFSGGVFRPNAREGDLLIFPSIVPHCSPPVLSNVRKTIIALNMRFEY